MDMKRIAVALLVALMLFVSARPASSQVVVGMDRGPKAPHLLNDQPAEAYQLELLALAWDAATAYPINPHIKNRARAEEQVVHGALALDQAHLAWGYAKKVVNWRRGACYAEIAHYLLAQHDPEHVEYFLQQALQHSKDAKQGWRHARVKARVAAARVVMGSSDDEVDALIEEEDAQARGQKISAQALIAEAQDFDRLVASLDALVSSEGYEAILAALDGYADLYARYYDNPQRRAMMLAKTRLAWQGMPGVKRFETVLRFADAALAHDDQANARDLIDEADNIRQAFAWEVGLDLRLRSEVARYRIKLGEQDDARAMLDDASAFAEANLQRLQNFNRAYALRPVAEAYAELGDKARAHTLYENVVQLGSENPNLRPRISDITATCVSMALHGIDPDPQLRRTIEQIVSGLTSP